jgi:hypothetical protein
LVHVRKMSVLSRRLAVLPEDITMPNRSIGFDVENVSNKISVIIVDNIWFDMIGNAGHYA